jgi:nitrite reductase/ring-hydroxylating ferredoxin subunit
VSEITKEDREGIKCAIIVFFLCWSIVGSFVGYYFTHDGGCTHKNIAAYINPGYLITCAIFKPRFNLDDKP